MAIGDVTAVTAGDCTDLSYVDTGMYDVAGYGSVYVLDAERPTLVDTGIGTNHERVLDAVREVGLGPVDIEVIAVTHVHLDHAGGAGFLVDECPNADVYVHGIGAPHLADPGRLWEGTKRAVGDQITYYTEPEPVPEERIVEISDDETIDLGDHALEVSYTPGHAPHQVVFHDPANDAVFTADAAGIYAPSIDTVFPTSPPPNFDPEGCQDDVDKLREIQPDVLCYAHFGAVETGDRLVRYADVLDEWVDAVAAKWEELRAERGQRGAERDERRVERDERRVERDERRVQRGDEGAVDDAVVEHFVAEADAERELWGTEKAEAEVAMNVRGVLRALDESG